MQKRPKKKKKNLHQESQFSQQMLSGIPHGTVALLPKQWRLSRVTKTQARTWNWRLQVESPLLFFLSLLSSSSSLSLSLCRLVDMQHTLYRYERLISALGSLHDYRKQSSVPSPSATTEERLLFIFTPSTHSRFLLLSPTLKCKSSRLCSEIHIYISIRPNE